MMMRSEIKDKSKQMIKGKIKFLTPVSLFCIYILPFIKFSFDNLAILFRRFSDIIMSIHGALDFVIMSGISLGLACFFLKLVSEGNTEYEDFFFAYKNIFSAMLLSLLEGIFIFLWTLLFIIPGIVAAYRYKMAFYILAESTNISPLDAIRISKKMTKGRKMELFIFDLSFIGWFLLTAITFGITGIYVYPYYNTARTVMYKEIKKEYIDKKAAERKNEIENENEVNTEL